MTIHPPGAWYVAYAAVRKEKQAECSLREAGYDAYMPFSTHWARSGRRKYKAQTPLFGRYLFVFVPGEAGSRDFYRVGKCEGVERLIGITGTPSDIPTPWVHTLRQQQLLGDFDRTLDRNLPEGPFKTDDPVKVRVGKWGQMTGIVQGMTQKAKVKVLFSMFGKDHVKEFAADELEAA